MGQSRVSVTAALALSALVSSGCYHAKIITGATPSAEVINEKWASSFVYGLVPPNTVNAAAKCPHGVATVETQHSFLNGLVAILTFGIYTPIQITVTCAVKQAALGDAPLPVVAIGGDLDTRAAIMQAADLAVALNTPVQVQLHE